MSDNFRTVNDDIDFMNHLADYAWSHLEDLCSTSPEEQAEVIDDYNEVVDVIADVKFCVDAELN